MDLLKKALLERFSFPEGDIRVLTDSAATRQGIMDAFRDHLIAKASPGALVYFHYSGHGQQIADDNGDELDGLDESLVTADYKSQSAQDGAATNLRDDTIGELLRQLRTRMVDPADGRFKGNITVTFDCCFSGTATRGEPPSGRLTHRGRGWNEAIDGPRPPARRGASRTTPPGSSMRARPSPRAMSRSPQPAATRPPRRKWRRINSRWGPSPFTSTAP